MTEPFAPDPRLTEISVYYGSLMQKATALAAERRALANDAIIGRTAPLAGRVDCLSCHGAGAYIEVLHGGGVSVGDMLEMEVVRRCDCTTIARDGLNG